VSRHELCVLALLPLSAALAPALEAQQPTRVAVEVRLADAKYTNHFHGQERAVEERLTTVITGLLAQEIGFVRFVPNGSEPYRLSITLDRRDTLSTGHFVDRGVRVKLVQPRGTSSVFWLKLLDATESAKSLASVEELARDIELAARREGFGRVMELLREVPVSNEALWIGDSKGWALPLPPDTLCLLHGTLLAVVNDESTPSVNRFIRYDNVQVTGSARPHLPPPFRGGVFGEPSIVVDRGKVREVFVTDYRRDTNCRRQPAAPHTGAGGSS
jgi:hypothetical protein